MHSLQSNYDLSLVMSPCYLPLVLVPRRINVCVLISSMSSVPHQHTHDWRFVTFSCVHIISIILCHVFIHIVCHYINLKKLKKNKKNMQKMKKKTTKKEFKSCRRLSQIVQRQSFLLQIWENFKYFYWLVWCSVHVCHSNYLLSH